MMFWDKPEYKAYEPQSFQETVTKITCEMTEDDVTKYWYNKGHEDGRKVATVKEQRMIDVLMELAKYRLLSKDEIAELAILRKASEK